MSYRSRLASRRLRARALLSAGAAAALACRDALPPEVPGASPYRALPAYAFWWALVEQCSGLRGDFAAVRWSRVPGAEIPGSSERLGPGGSQGQWAPARNEVTVVARDTASGPLIRHEMLHALLGPGASGHPAGYFGGRCGGYVVCEGDCAAEIAAGTPTPAAAPACRPDDLVVTARLLAPAGGATAAGGTFAVLVTARNPASTAGWVEREPGAAVTEAIDFGVTLDGPPPVASAFPYSSLHASPGARTFFAPGAEAHYVFDLDAGTFRPAAYQLRGSFAGAPSGPTSVTLPP